MDIQSTKLDISEISETKIIQTLVSQMSGMVNNFEELKSNMTMQQRRSG